MNENIDLTKILKDCPKGWPLYTSITGRTSFHSVDEKYVRVETQGWISRLTSGGKVEDCPEGECIIFPSREQRDWSKFEAPWYKSGKFDPKTLKAFDKVLVRDERTECWRCEFYSHLRKEAENTKFKYAATANSYARCIPYNEDTKHLVGTTGEVPEYYRYWED